MTMTRLAVTILVFLTAGAAPAQGFGELEGPIASYRTGDWATLDAQLLREQARGPRLKRAVASFVLARVHAAQGNGKAARAALSKAGAIRNISVPAWRWAEFEVLLAEGHKRKAFEKLGQVRARHKKFRWAAADLMYSRLQEQLDEPMRTAQTALALMDKSRLHLPGDELLDRAARMMEGPSPKQAAKLWRGLIMRFPESPLADKALQRLGDVLSDAERLERAETLFARRDYERCRKAALALWNAGYERPTAGFFLGKIGSERLRDDYKSAEEYLAVASQEGAPYADSALISYGIVLMKNKKTDAAKKAFDLWLVRYKNEPAKRVVEVHYDRGRALHVGGRSREAARDLKRYLEKHKKGFDYDKYWWFVGFWTYLAGDYAEAVALMKPLLARKNSLVGGKARYWTAKALHKLGQKTQAIEALVQLSRRHPLTYYSALGEQRLAEWGAAKKIPERRDLSRVKSARVGRFDGLPDDAYRRRLEAAIYLGEPDTLRRVLELVERKWRKKVGEERLATLRADLGDHTERVHEARRAARKAHGRVLRRYPNKKTVGQWRQIYPRAFATHVTAAAKRFGVSEHMVYAHMLQESRYNPTLISGAPAYGLLELLDRTAKRLAAGHGDTYQLWMLMEPKWNVHWGVMYLGALVKKFHGQIPFAVGSYNGGPMLWERHMGKQKGVELDRMVDDLGTHECRNYTRRVLEHFLRYLAIYESPKRARKLRDTVVPKRWQARWRAQPDY